MPFSSLCAIFFKDKRKIKYTRRLFCQQTEKIAFLPIKMSRGNVTEADLGDLACTIRATVSVQIGIFTMAKDILSLSLICFSQGSRPDSSTQWTHPTEDIVPTMRFEQINGRRVVLQMYVSNTCILSQTLQEHNNHLCSRITEADLATDSS